ncbi:LPS-assembly protein [Devosia crocina]|uniref:LPS-assembly protein LptD n=1 Tax=Devosia crocina TaxID=429728 RepID=A0A1I7NKX9_9HYPH|nr:LPS assembly protein LptD [Devosia crocina]SFV35266.1 LPS-assembly protein [Devosia crocina]
MTKVGRSITRGLACALMAGAGALALPGLSLAQGFVPPDFFSAAIDPDGAAGVEADALTFNSQTGVIEASGNVILTFEGYTVQGSTLTFDRRSGQVRMTGRTRLIDPSGNVAESDGFAIEGDMRQAVLNALTITSYDGARITADSVDYDTALQTILNDAGYAPCGECIDEEGRRIGWSVQAAKITYNAEDGSVVLEQPSLALLGIPVAWLPYLWLPGTDEDALRNVRMPRLDYSDQMGLKLAVPVSVYSSRWTDVILTPTLVSRQGFLMDAEWIQRFDAGSFQIRASGLYQFDPAAFAGEVGDRDWRGAIQTSGEFTPIETWKVGWSYSVFTDAAYLDDYRVSNDKSTVNQVYATHLTDDTYIDARVQEFNLLGNVTEAQQRQQGRNLPVVRFSHVLDLEEDWGRLTFDGKLLHVNREADAVSIVNGVPYVFGHQGNKTHATLQAGWETQWIAPGGLVFSPYAGGRADFSYYDGTSPLLPEETSLIAATPIAAIDVRYPLMASNGADVHIIEPIVQLAYRGSDNSLVGITNDDAQSLVFDDTNLFSYDRFSGYDRQDIGLRANVGGRYQANFANGRYLEIIAGQSFLLAGANAYTEADPVRTGIGSGLEDAASYGVLGAYGSIAPGIDLAGKLQVNTSEWEMSRVMAGARFAQDGYSASLDYRFVGAEPVRGVLQDQHEVAGQLTLPVSDYWKISGNAAWDLGANTWLQVGGGVLYDDGYLAIGAGAVRTGPTHRSPDDTRFTATFQLKTPAGLNAGYEGNVLGAGF